MILEGYLAPLLGGVLIGLAAAGFMLFGGRIAGISGVIGPLLAPRPGDISWRLSFAGGLVAGGLVLLALAPATLESSLERSLPALAVAGLLVGFGTRLGSGCTSGHGVCGVARLSRRSLVATVTFTVAGMAVAALVTHGFGGTI